MEIRLAAREIENKREAEVVMRLFVAFEQKVGRENEKELTAQEELLWPPTLMTESPHAGKPGRGAGSSKEQWKPLQASWHVQLLVTLITSMPF